MRGEQSEILLEGTENLHQDTLSVFCKVQESLQYVTCLKKTWWDSGLSCNPGISTFHMEAQTGVLALLLPIQRPSNVWGGSRRWLNIWIPTTQIKDPD